MSDGSISLVTAWGPAEFELARPVLVRPTWLDALGEAEQTLRGCLLHAVGRAHWKDGLLGRKTVVSEPPPSLPDDMPAFLKSVADGDDPFPRWSWSRDKAVDAVNRWNDSIDVIWNCHMGMGDDQPRKARDRRKLGYTEWLTPAVWLKTRPRMKRYRIALRAFTGDMYAEGTEKLMAFLTEGQLPDGVSMDRNLPKLRHQVAGNVVWFIRQVLGWIDTEDVDICSDCGRVIRPDSETADWCSKCAKMRCDGCSTRPHDCECDHPCARHCTCKTRNE